MLEPELSRSDIWILFLYKVLRMSCVLQLVISSLLGATKCVKSIKIMEN